MIILETFLSIEYVLFCLTVSVVLLAIKAMLQEKEIKKINKKLGEK